MMNDETQTAIERPLHRLISLRWKRMADGYYTCGNYSAFRIKGRWIFRVNGLWQLSGVSLRQCKLEAIRREQANEKGQRRVNQ